MLDYSVPTALMGAAFGSAILAAFLFYLSRLGGAHPALGWWSGALTFNVARYLLLLEASLPPGERPAPMVVGAAHLADVASVGMVGCLIAGSFVFFERRAPYTALVGAAVVAASWLAIATFLGVSPVSRSAPLYLAGGVAMIIDGWKFLRRHRVEPALGYGLAGASLTAWGALLCAFPLYGEYTLATTISLIASSVLAIAIALSLVIAVQLRQERATRDQMKRAHHSEGRLFRQTALLQELIDNLPIGVSLVDRNLNAVAFNRQFLELLEFPPDRFAIGDPFEKFIRFNAERGEYGDGDIDKLVRDRVALAANPRAHCFERVRPDGHTIEIRGTPLPGGGFATTYIDVTERKAVANRLSASEARFRDFAESASDWLWEQDADLRFTYISGGRSRRSPAAPDESDAIWREGFVPMGVTSEQWARHKAELAERRPFRDLRIQRIDRSGRVRHLAISGIPVFGAAGEFCGYRGTTTDITERIDIEQRAQAAQERLASAIEGLSDGLALFDRNDGLIMCNRAYRDLIGPAVAILSPGVTFEAIVRETVRCGRYDIAPGGDEELIASRLAEHAGLKTAVERHLTDGRWVQLRDHRLSDGGVAVIATDITSIKGRERLLGEKSDLLQRTLENMGEGISVYDREMRLIAWNDRLVELLGLPAGFVQVGMSFEALLRYQAATGEIGADDADEMIRQVIGSLDTADGTRHGSWRPNGRYIELRCNPMPEGGFVTLYSDTTERVRAEIALRDAKESAELANRTKTEFLANMSHELRTPLNAIIGFSELIHRQTFGPLGSERYGEYAQDILDSGRHLLKLINDILDVSKMEAGKVELDESEVRIDQVIRSSARLVSGRAREANVRLSLPHSANLPPLRADERRLKQVLLNLLSNAIKFTPPGGQVSVEANPANGSGLTIKVSDTGIGIHPADIAKVLSPFGQVDSNLSRRYDGTGLGLPLSKALIELHGGRLSIDSEVGVGTTVTVTLPADRIIRH